MMLRSACVLLLAAAAFVAPADEHGLMASYTAADSSIPPLQRIDATIDFDWGDAAPAAGFASDHFQARWTGLVTAGATGVYQIATDSDDGVRVLIDRRVVIDDWSDHAPRRDVGSVFLTAGQSCEIDVTMYENAGGAVVRLLWAPPGGALTVVPTDALTPAALPDTPLEPGGGSGLRASYYPDEAFAGGPTQRVDPAVDLPGTVASPQRDHWSAIWEGAIEAPQTDEYLLSLSGIGVAQVWVDGALVLQLDARGSRAACSSPALTWLADSRHDVVIRYSCASEAAISLWWSSTAFRPTLVPSARLWPQPLEDSAPVTIADLPAACRTSPAWIAGTCRRGAVVSASIDGGAVPVVADDERSWRLAVSSGDNEGLALDPSRPVRLAVDDGDGEVIRDLAWTVTDLADTYGIDPLLIRVGDSLLLTDTRGSGSVEIDLECADDNAFRARIAGAPGQAAPWRFARAGTWRIRSRVDGALAGTLTVHVISAAISPGTACQVGWTRLCSGTCSEAPSTEFAVTDARGGCVVAQPAGDGAATLVVSALSLARTDLVARLACAPHAVIARRRLDAFTLRTTSELSMPVVDHLADGSLVCEATLLLDPAVADLEVRLHVFVSGVTFDDGRIDRVVPVTSFMADPWSNDGRVRAAYRLVRAPGTTTGMCHSMVAFQDGVQVSY